MILFLKKWFLLVVLCSITLIVHAQSNNVQIKVAEAFKLDSGITAPVFPGGNQGWSHFLSYYIRYPHNAYIQGIQGKVIVQIYIEADGSVANPIVLSSPSEDLSNESLRVIALSPKWKPATKDGKPIKVKYAVPITFALAAPPKQMTGQH